MMTDGERGRIGRIAARYEGLKQERSGFLSLWKSIGDLFLPGRYRDDTDTDAQRRIKLSPVVNSRPRLALRTLASGMQGGMTSPARPWFRLGLRQPWNGDGSGEVRKWLDDVTQAMITCLHHSNFYDAAHDTYEMLGAFGTALLIETADADGLRFMPVRAGEYVLDVDSRGRPDTFFRRISMTARQAAQQFGRDRLPDNMSAALKSPGQADTQRFEIVHGVFPAEDEPGSGDGRHAFASVYFTQEGQGATILEEGGYNMFPAFAPRWSATGLDVYGRSPAMDVLPDARSLQKMDAQLLRLQHLLADPPMMLDATLKGRGVDLNPGGKNFADLRSSGGAYALPVYSPMPAAVASAENAVLRAEERISAGLYSDLFRLLIDSTRRNVTATEIEAKQQEKMLLLGPVVERLHQEFLEPLIRRTFGLMREWNALPPMPDILRGENGEIEAPPIDVAFESVLAQAQKLMATTAIEQGLNFIARVASACPEALDIVHVDRTVRSYGERIGMPEGCLNDEGEVARIRKARAAAQSGDAEQAQAGEAIDMALKAAQAGKALSQTQAGAADGSLMAQLIGGLGRL
ncbi:MAG: portal protein [Desulfovibrionaceae bacterium]|nr:portal protein [Desulfovibrionaceae bacterium]